MNFIQHYVAIAITAAVAIKGLVLWKNKNTTNNLIALAAVPISASFVFFGVPALFTTDPRILQLGFVIGDPLQYLGLFFLWLAVIRVYTPNNSVLRIIATVIVSLLTIVTTLISIRENTSHYPDMYFTGKYWLVDYEYTTLHMSVAAVNYSVFAFLGIYFINQSKNIESTANKWRLRIYGLSFTVVGAVMILGAIFGSGVDSAASILVLIFAYFLLGFILLANQVHKKLKSKEDKQN